MSIAANYRRKSKNRLPVEAIAGSIFGIASLLLMCWLMGSHESRPPVNKPAVSAGEIGYLSAGGGSLLICTTRDAHSQFVRFAVARDEHGFSELLLNGQAFAVEHGTRVRVLGGITVREVRVIEGPMTGRRGYISSEFILSK